MHKTRVLNSLEHKVDVILQRCLAEEAYRVCPKIRLADAIPKDTKEWLSTRDFAYYTKAHLDFLVTRDDFPVFALEFDGISHFEDQQAIENDVIKNRLCKLAKLPLLRITSSQIEYQDQLTLLDYMLMRYVAWEKEYPSIMQEIQDFAATIGPDYDPDQVSLDFDPSVHFDLRHPFPARRVVVERLWSNHGIALVMAKPDRHRTATYLCDMTYGSGGPSENEQFYKHTRRVVVTRPSGSGFAPVFSRKVSVSLRFWLPLRTEVPSPDLFELFGGKMSGPDSTRRAEESFNQFMVRARSMWFPHLPGIHTPDVAEHYSEYLALRAVERWAKSLRERGRETTP